MQSGHIKVICRRRDLTILLASRVAATRFTHQRLRLGQPLTVSASCINDGIFLNCVH